MYYLFLERELERGERERERKHTRAMTWPAHGQVVSLNWLRGQAEGRRHTVSWGWRTTSAGEMGGGEFVRKVKLIVEVVD